MKNRKGAGNMALGIMVVLIMLGVTGAFVFAGIQQGWFSKPVEGSVASSTTVTQQVAQASNAGKVATVKVFVRDLANTDTNTKLAVATYCQDEEGQFVIDGTTSSTSAEISGQSTRGKTVTCWAFSSTVQTMKPTVVTIDEDVEHVLVDAYTVATNGKLQFYTDTLATGTGGVINVTGVGASTTGTLSKLRYTNNETSKFFPLGGVYLDTVVNSNVSTIAISGNGAYSGVPNIGENGAKVSAVSWKDSTNSLSTTVSARKEQWNFVFEVDADSSAEGNQAIVLEDGDYVESGSVRVTGDGEGCGTSAVDLISSYAFTKGYYKSSIANDVKYGHETDAASAAVISTSTTGDTFYCRA